LLTSETGEKSFCLQRSLIKPGMDSPMKIQGQFQMTSQSQVNHRCSSGLSFHSPITRGHWLPTLFAKPIYAVIYLPSEIIYEEIVFNMETYDKVISHGAL